MLKIVFIYANCVNREQTEKILLEKAVDVTASHKLPVALHSGASAFRQLAPCFSHLSWLKTVQLYSFDIAHRCCCTGNVRLGP